MICLDSQKKAVLCAQSELELQMSKFAKRLLVTDDNFAQFISIHVHFQHSYLLLLSIGNKFENNIVQTTSNPCQFNYLDRRKKYYSTQVLKL